MLARTVPVLQELGHVPLTPLSYVGERALRETAPQNRTVLNPDGDLVVPVVRVKVRRVVNPLEHADHDPEEAADLRHTPILLAPQEMLRITRD